MSKYVNYLTTFVDDYPISKLHIILKLLSIFLTNCTSIYLSMCVNFH